AHMNAETGRAGLFIDRDVVIVEGDRWPVIGDDAVKIVAAELLVDLDLQIRLAVTVDVGIDEIIAGVLPYRVLAGGIGRIGIGVAIGRVEPDIGAGPAGTGLGINQVGGFRVVDVDAGDGG